MTATMGARVKEEVVEEVKEEFRKEATEEVMEEVMDIPPLPYQHDQYMERKVAKFEISSQTDRRESPLSKCLRYKIQDR